jgi:hypothetical protein
VFGARLPDGEDASPPGAFARHQNLHRREKISARRGLYSEGAARAQQDISNSLCRFADRHLYASAETSDLAPEILRMDDGTM